MDKSSSYEISVQIITYDLCIIIWFSILLKNYCVKNVICKCKGFRKYLSMSRNTVSKSVGSAKKKNLTPLIYSCLAILCHHFALPFKRFSWLFASPNTTIMTIPRVCVWKIVLSVNRTLLINSIYRLGQQALRGCCSPFKL